MDTEPAATDNPACPDFTAHYENAADRLYPDRRTNCLTADEDAAVLAEAAAEYAACEGH